MRKIALLVLLSVSLVDGQALIGRTPDRAIETHEAMVHGVNPAMLVISDTVETARSNADGLDPTLMDQASWARLESAAHSLEYSSRQMARATVLRVGAHTAEVSGFANKAEIQAKLDADPARFRTLSLEMAKRAATLRAEAHKQDSRSILDHVNNLNASCQTCHTHYWEKL